MPDTTGAIAELIRLLPWLRELPTRSHPIQVATVTDNQDPTGNRRIRVTREAQGGQSQSDWIQAGRSSSTTDEPLPPVGTTVLVAVVEGATTELWMLRTASNDTNPPDDEQDDPIADNTNKIPGREHRMIGGDELHEVEGEETRRTKGNLTVISEGEKLTVACPYGDIDISALEGSGEITIRGSFSVRLEQGGASLVAQDGFWRFRNANGQEWGFGGPDGGNEWVWNANGAAIRIINANDFSINDKSAIVVGSTDSDNDTNDKRGY